jgi:protein-arginine kinase activator protein McsA
MCGICAQFKAVGRVFEITKSSIRELSLCASCLETAEAQSRIFSFRQISEDLIKNLDPRAKKLLTGEECPACGRSFKSYITAPAPVDCRYCTRFFAPLMASLAKIMPVEDWQKPRELELRILQMKERLEALIHDDRFEEARRVADRIKDLEAGLARPAR